MRRAFSTSAVARMLGVAVGSVANWIDQGQLKAGKTPGGHRRVVAENLVEFLRQQNLPVPPRLTHRLTVRVLVVDDDEAIATWVANEIRVAHPEYDVMTAPDGFSAGEIVGSMNPDAVILDLRMPGLDGYEVCRRIKSKKETKYIAVIAMTAETSAKAEKRILECGARALLAKPLHLESLLRELDAALEGED
jgi:excisionase family DNA binding protein